MVACYTHSDTWLNARVAVLRQSSRPPHHESQRYTTEALTGTIFVVVGYMSQLDEVDSAVDQALEICDPCQQGM